MAKVKVINNTLDQNLNGENFTNVPSNTIFSFGSFTVTSNFDGRQEIDYTTKLSTFVSPISVSGLTLTDEQSRILYNQSSGVTLNLNKSDLNTYVKFGSAYEFLRTAFQNIITNYPGSLLISGQINAGGNETFQDFSYNSYNDTSSFKIPTAYAVNTFGMSFDYGNPVDDDLLNLNTAYDKYIIWSIVHSGDTGHNIIGFTGDTSTDPFMYVEVDGNPFPNFTGTTGYFDIHIRPNNQVFEQYRTQLSDYEQYIIAERENYDGFRFTLKDPTLLDNGNISYSDISLLWTTTDGYNLDINTPSYDKILNIVLTIGKKYDQIKTDLIARFLTPSSLQTYDLTDEGKMEKLLRIYGQEFDVLKQFIDSLVNVNTVTYDKIKNLPDQIVSNMAKTFGWEYFNLVNEEQLVSGFLSIDDTERNLHTDLLPAEVNIELWRRILMNTNYFWKSKGTRKAIKSMFLLIGIPEPFINITEYVYTVEGRIDPRKVELDASDFASSTVPYNTLGYPVAPAETSDFYFQMSGDSDSGQAYMDNFRLAGFNLLQTVDNRKAWIQTGATTRICVSTPQYYQEDSKLVLNTKEVDVALDVSRGIEYDVQQYAQIDYQQTSSGYTLPLSYVNVSLGLTGTTASTFSLNNTFTSDSQQTEGDFEVRFNGILLNAPKTGTTSGVTDQADYIVGDNSFTLTNGNVAKTGDIVQVTYLYSGGTSAPLSAVSISYLVTRIQADTGGTFITLPATPSGDIQLTINGIALTKGTGQFQADYIVDPNDNTRVVIQNTSVISYLQQYPNVQVAFVAVTGSTSIQSRTEIYRVDSFTAGKLRYSSNANKNIFKLDYKVNSAADVKVLIDGIALAPLKDYTVNSANKYELFLPPTIRFGSVISVYYIIGGGDYVEALIGADFGLGDVTELSFLEFIEQIQRRLINARNRKIITNFKGGWYPTLLKLYIDYLQRAYLSEDDPLHSWGYTFENLYPFLSKYNAFFQRFVDQLLSSTIILRKGGLLIRNTVFSRQKFAYKRGVYMGVQNTRSSDGTTTYIPDTSLYYLGDDGATFFKRTLFRSLSWTDDFVCTDDFCQDFNVSGVTITYPVTTTTTTQYPYQAVLQLSSTESYLTISGPYDAVNYTNTITFTFNPDIIPDYDVDFNINLNSTNIVTATATNNDGYSDIYYRIRKNGTIIQTVAHLEDGVDTGPTGTTSSDVVSVSMTNGDVLVVEVETYTVQANYQAGYVVSAEYAVRPDSFSVTPNGTISSAFPVQITETINVSD